MDVNRAVDVPRVAVQTDIAGEPILMVAPVTSNLKASRFRFTVEIAPSAMNGLSEPSVIMVFQMRAIDKAHIIKKLGRLSENELALVDAEIWKMLKP